MAYQSEDHSILRAALWRYLFGPLLLGVPASISPNALTWAGLFCSALAALGAWQIADTRVGAALSAVCVLAYLCFDNLDGAHARRTGQSSPTGELLDHWFDGWSTAFVAFAVARALNLPSKLLLVWLAAGVLVYAFTFLEQRATGRIVWGAIGTNEALVVAIGLLCGVAVFGAPPPLLEWVSLLVLVVPAWTVVLSLFRIGNALPAWELSRGPLGLGGIALWSWAGLSDAAAGALILVLAPATGGVAVVMSVCGDQPPKTLWGAMWLALGIGVLGGIALGVGDGPAFAIAGLGAVFACADFVGAMRRLG